MENNQSFANFIENLNSMTNLLKLYCVACYVNGLTVTCNVVSRLRE